MTIEDSRPLRVRPVGDAASRRAWLDVPYRVFRDDPNWVAPLRLIENQRFTAKHPFFSFGEAQLFVAFRGDEPVGRISAHVNRRHLELHQDGAGHFGFFDCQDDPAAARALVDNAKAWLRARGLERMLGPFNFSTNEESGLLVEGFDTPPAIMMTHARPWFGALLEQAGLIKAMDLYAYRLNAKAFPERLKRLADRTGESERIRVRSVDVRRLEQEVSLLMDIYNDAWSRNWGFVPFSPIEIKAMVDELRPFFRPNYGRVVTIDDKPAAVMLALPDVNGMIAGFNGRLLPFNGLRLLSRFLRSDIRGARIPLLGITREHQHGGLAAGVLALLVREFARESQLKSLEWVEFSWVLENNKPMNDLGRFAAGPPVKTFRIYSAELNPPN